MINKTQFYWLANGYLLTGMLAGIGVGVNLGPFIASSLEAQQWPKGMAGMIGMGMICVAVIANGLLYMRTTRLSSRAPANRELPISGNR